MTELGPGAEWQLLAWKRAKQTFSHGLESFALRPTADIRTWRRAWPVPAQNPGWRWGPKMTQNEAVSYDRKLVDLGIWVDLPPANNTAPGQPDTAASVRAIPGLRTRRACTRWASRLPKSNLQTLVMN